MIEMECPHCGHQLRIRSKYAGKQGQCKHCQGFVDVPNTYAAEVEEEARRAAAELPTTPINRPAKPEKGTALADLMADGAPAAESPIEKPPREESTALDDLKFDDAPGSVKPTVPMPPEAIDSITGDDAPAKPPYKRLGCLYWFLAIFVTPAALIWGILLPSGHPQKKMAIVVPIALIGVGVLLSVGFFVVLPLVLLSSYDAADGQADVGGLTIDPPVVNMEVSPSDYVMLQTTNQNGMEHDLTWSSSDPSIAKVVGHPRSAMVYGMAPGTATVTAEVIMTGEQATATVVVSESAAAESTGVAYAQTRLPSYAGLVFEEADHSENFLEGALADADPSELTTFVGYSAKEYETITNYFFQELQNRNWNVDAFGYGDAANNETYIIATNAGNGIVYRTSADGDRTKVVITYGPIPEGP